MAERRMFAKSIVESDAFHDMPAEAQALYFHLNMAADDDGFVDNPRSIMRQCDAKDDTMKILIGKKFVLTFEKKDGFIVVVKHWRVNNFIRSDRYKESRYKELMRELYYDENNSYSMNPDDGHRPCINPGTPTDNQLTTNGIPTDNQMDTQVRLGKDRLESGKDSSGEDRQITLFEKENKEKDSFLENKKFYLNLIHMAKLGSKDYQNFVTSAKNHGIELTQEEIDNA